MKKIMFSDKYGLTSAVLSGNKTQTRRIIKNPSRYISPYLCDGRDRIGEVCVEKTIEQASYKVGEVIAVAQSYRAVSNEVFLFSTKVKVRGKENRAGWVNKMFVKSELMPHHIRIINIRIERLQDISDEDCLAEGITVSSPPLQYMAGYWTDHTDKYKMFTTPREAYAVLIDKVSGKGTWDSNPWVLVYDFELIK